MKPFGTVIIAAILCLPLCAQTSINEHLSVDATDAARNFIHARVSVPVDVRTGNAGLPEMDSR